MDPGPSDPGRCSQRSNRNDRFPPVYILEAVCVKDDWCSLPGYVWSWNICYVPVVLMSVNQSYLQHSPVNASTHTHVIGVSSKSANLLLFGRPVGSRISAPSFYTRQDGDLQ